jgi:nucleotide-binding universal stress UspA family protein
MSSNALSENGMLNRVLVATDGSDYSDGAIRTGVALAKARSARLIGLSIILYHSEYSTLVPNLQEEAERRARDALKSFIEAAGAGAEAITREAVDPSAGIVVGARENSADIIVMGRRGKRGLARMMVGDATAKVIGHASCPVLVAPRAARLWEKHILLATDGSQYSEAAAGAAGHLARQAGLPVTVVSVTTASHSGSRCREAELAVAATVERLKGMGLKAEGRVVQGRPDEAIVKLAEAIGADLIVMGSHGRTGLNKILLGSVVERVIGQAACPVLVARP